MGTDVRSQRKLLLAPSPTYTCRRVCALNIHKKWSFAEKLHTFWRLLREVRGFPVAIKLDRSTFVHHCWPQCLQISMQIFQVAMPYCVTKYQEAVLNHLVQHHQARRILSASRINSEGLRRVFLPNRTPLKVIQAYRVLSSSQWSSLNLRSITWWKWCALLLSSRKDIITIQNCDVRNSENRQNIVEQCAHVPIDSRAKGEATGQKKKLGQKTPLIVSHLTVLKHH